MPYNKIYYDSHKEDYKRNYQTYKKLHLVNCPLCDKYYLKINIHFLSKKHINNVINSNQKTQ